MTSLNSPSLGFSRVIRLLLFAAVLLMAQGFQSAYAAGGAVTDAQIDAVRKFFGETEHGVPGEKFRGKSVAELESIIDDQFAAELYKLPNALAALQRIFTSSQYQNINARLGIVRNQVNLESWAEVVQRYGIRTELNDAGKANGALSDLDKFLFTDADSLPGENIPRDKIHSFLIEQHKQIWSARMRGTSPADFDIAHFPGDGLMADWRMSNSHWRRFSLELGASIARLAGTEGAYFIPGAYKTQVYTRYHLEGRTTVIQPAKGNPEDIPHFKQDIPKLVPGVYVSEDLPTRNASLRYKDIPFGIDRTGALGSAVQNYIAADETVNTVKNAKYSNRKWNTALNHLTNLEVDFQRLILTGPLKVNGQTVDVKKYQIKKLFGRFVEGNDLPHNIESLTEIERIIDRLAEIELDKVLGASRGPRPKHWTEKWRKYEPKDPNELTSKLKYFAEEIAEIRKAFQPGDLPDDARLAELGERLFRQKAQAVGRMSISVAAERVFSDVFTRQGFARQRYLYGESAARRLLVERVKELHVSFIFIKDHNLINQIISKAPPETQRALKLLADIAEAQHDDVVYRKSRVAQISDNLPNLKAALNEGFIRDLAKKLGEGDVVVKELMRKLALGQGQDPNLPKAPPNIPGLTRVRLGDLAYEYARQEISLTMREALIRRAKEGKIRLAQGARSVKQFFDADLPTALTNRNFVTGYKNNLMDLGTLDSTGRILEAYARGDTEGVDRETRDLVLANVPIAGKAWSFSKSLKSLEAGNSTPTLLFIFQTLLSSSTRGAKYGKFLGVLCALRGLEETLYKLGWHFYVKPSQQAFVSYILMGDLSGFHGRSAGNRLPTFTDPDTGKLLKQHAILPKTIPLPDISKKYRNSILRAHFLAAANRTATSLGRSEPGEGTPWWEDRERTLQVKYFHNWKYWFRRLSFYKDTHLKFAAWVNQNTTNANWRDISETVPDYLKDKPQAVRLEEFGDAYKPKVDGSGGRWDHERVWLRRYFSRWVKEWASAQRQAKEHGEILYYLDTVGIVGNWQDAATSELVNYYLEGETLEHAQWKAQEGSRPQRSEQAAAAEQYRESLGRGLRELAGRILEEEGKKRLETFLRLEELFWNPEVKKRFEQGIVSAAESQAEYRPKPPKFVVTLPRPVGRWGLRVPAEMWLYGDAQSMPDDLEMDVDYEPVREYKRERPSAVLKDDVRAVFPASGGIEDKNLHVIEHKATFRVSSKKDPSFTISEVKTVYWLKYLLDEDEDEQGNVTPGTGGPTDGPTVNIDDLLEEMRRNRARSAVKKKKSDEDCGEGKKKTGSAEEKNKAVKAVVSALEADVESLRSELTALKQSLADAVTKNSSVTNSARRLAELRDKIGVLRNEICDKKDLIKSSVSPNERKQLLGEVRRLLADAKSVFTRAKTHFETVKKGAAEIKAAAEISKAFQVKLTAIREQLTKLDTSIDESAEDISQAKENLSSAESAAEEVETIRAQGAELLEKGKQVVAASGEQTPTLQAIIRQMAGLYGDIEKDKTAAKDCTETGKKTLAPVEKDKIDAEDKSEGFASSLETMEAELADTNLLSTMDTLVSESAANLSVVEAFWDTIENRLEEAEECATAAEREAAAQILATVPDVRNKSIANAVGMLKTAGFSQYSLTGGDRASGRGLAFKVQNMSPAYGTQAEVNTPIGLNIFSGYEVEVPNVMHRSEADARRILSSALLSANVRTEGRPPNETLAKKVSSQFPAAQRKVEPNSTVQLVLYGNALSAIPSLRGLAPDIAMQRLKAAGFARMKIAGGDAAPEQALSLKVDKTIPGPGPVDPGTTVTIVVYAKAREVPNIEDVRCFANSHPVWMENLQKYGCKCNDGYKINAWNNACLPGRDVLIRNTNCVPNSDAYWDNSVNDVRCRCRPGHYLSPAKRILPNSAQLVAAANCFANSTAKWDNSSNQARCYCNTGYRINAALNACNRIYVAPTPIPTPIPAVRATPPPQRRVTKSEECRRQGFDIWDPFPSKCVKCSRGYRVHLKLDSCQYCGYSGCDSLRDNSRRSGVLSDAECRRRGADFWDLQQFMCISCRPGFWRNPSSDRCEFCGRQGCGPNTCSPGFLRSQSTGRCERR